MEEKKDIALSTKMILIGMCLIPIVFSGFFTYLNRIDAGDNVSDAFEAAFVVFTVFLIVAIFAFLLYIWNCKTNRTRTKKQIIFQAFLIIVF